MRKPSKSKTADTRTENLPILLDCADAEDAIIQTLKSLSNLFEKFSLIIEAASHEENASSST